MSAHFQNGLKRIIIKKKYNNFEFRVDDLIQIIFWNFNFIKIDFKRLFDKIY